jgi:hypothetical protein
LVFFVPIFSCFYVDKCSCYGKLFKKGEYLYFEKSL